LEQARRNAKEEKTLRLAAQASNEAWRAKYGPTEAQKAVRPSAPREGLALLRYLKDRAEAFTMADYSSEEILAAVKWAESWRENAIRLEGALSERGARFHVVHRALLRVGLERDYDAKTVECRECGMDVTDGGAHGVIDDGVAPMPCFVGEALALAVKAFP
jgi:hypothetical protein